MTPHPSPLDKLDRAELLALCKRRLFFVTPLDIINARSEAADERHQAATATATALLQKMPNVATFMSETNPARRARGLKNYRAAEAAYHTAQAKADRLWRQCERLWTEWQAESAKQQKGAA